MIIKMKVGTIGLTDNVSVCEELEDRFKTEISKLIEEQERIISADYPVRTRAVASLIAKINSPEKREELYENLANDRDYLEPLGMKVIKRNNKLVIVPRNYFVFMVQETESAFAYSKAAVRR